MTIGDIVFAFMALCVFIALNLSLWGLYKYRIKRNVRDELRSITGKVD